MLAVQRKLQVLFSPCLGATGMTRVGCRGLPPDDRSRDRPVPILLGWPTFRNTLGPRQTDTVGHPKRDQGT